MIFKFLETREGKENTVIVARKKLESKVRFGVSSTSRAVLCEIKRQREEREKLMTMRGILILNYFLWDDVSRHLHMSFLFPIAFLASVFDFRMFTSILQTIWRRKVILRAELL